MVSDDSRHPHMVNDIPYRAKNGNCQMVVEIPAGTNENGRRMRLLASFTMIRLMESQGSSTFCRTP